MNFCLKKYYKFTSLSVLFVFGIFFSFSLPTSHAAEIIISYNCEKVIGKTGTVFEGKKGVCADSVKPSGYCTDGGALSESDKYVQYKNLECSGFNTTYCCVPEEYDDSALSNHIKKSECESYAVPICEVFPADVIYQNPPIMSINIAAMPIAQITNLYSACIKSGKDFESVLDVPGIASKGV